MADACSKINEQTQTYSTSGTNNKIGIEVNTEEQLFCRTAVIQNSKTSSTSYEFIPFNNHCPTAIIDDKKQAVHVINQLIHSESFCRDYEKLRNYLKVQLMNCSTRAEVYHYGYTALETFRKQAAENNPLSYGYKK